MKNKSIILLILIAFLGACKTIQPKESAAANTVIKQDYSAERVENDPTNTQIYTLSNGLKVYLSINKEEPRIQTNIAVRAGSKNDPAETTGLAHYLEHMMFKGTHSIGTKNWAKEKKLLDKIAAKFEEHKNEKDEDKKRAIYKEIDKLSYEASKLAIANEYDKMISSLGANGTNAYTSFDRTVYINEIPSNELEKFLMVEGERFQTLVLRLFHTELETVYEEFNRSQDNDGRWVYQEVLTGLFPNHPYGTQTTIGLGEHLKNPSMYNIIDYFNTYYRPNNVAICLSGDLDVPKTLALIEKYFGNWKSGEIPEFKMPKNFQIEKPIEKETYGPQQEMLYLGYKFDGAGSKDAALLAITDMILSNSQAGLIDLNLKLKQKVLNASSFSQILKDYSVHFLYGIPKEGQSLEEVRDLLLAEINNLKNGDFDDWLVEACINNLKLNQIKTIESNEGRADMMTDAFINNINWDNYIFQYDALEGITKETIIEFANMHYKDNYVVSYKRKGEANRHAVPKPEITQLELDRDSKSTFFQAFEQVPSTRIEPEFIDFTSKIKQSTVAGHEFSYVKNENNELFSLSYIFDIGSDHSKEIALAAAYLPYLGTAKYSAEQLQKEFYRLALDFGVNVNRDKMYITLSGLEKNLKEGIQLFEHVLSNVQANESAYKEMVADILKKRTDAKLNKNTILRNGLVNYAKYGADNPFTDILSKEELEKINVESLVQTLRKLLEYQHRIYFYGSKSEKAIIPTLEVYHKPAVVRRPIPPIKEYKENSFDQTKIYFAPYDMQQVEVYLLAPDVPFNPKLMAASQLFNEYFGAGLSSIVFQEIREKKALAYSAYSFYSNAAKQKDNNYVFAYVGTQHDKLKDALTAINQLLNEMPQAELQFNGAKEAVLKQLETSRITNQNVYWTYESAKNRGVDYDLNKQMYVAVQKMTLADLVTFFEQHIKGKKYSICVIGNEKTVDKEILKSFGELKEMELVQLFNY